MDPQNILKELKTFTDKLLNEKNHKVVYYDNEQDLLIGMKGQNTWTTITCTRIGPMNEKSMKYFCSRIAYANDLYSTSLLALSLKLEYELIDSDKLRTSLVILIGFLSDGE